MPKFIFSNSSYLVSFNTPQEVKEINKKLAKEKKFKVAEVYDIDEFLDTIDRVKYFIDIYLFLDGIDQDTLNILFNALGPLKLDFILFNPSTDLDIPEKHHEKIVFGDFNEDFMKASFSVRDRSRMPGGLNKFSVSCANYIFPFIFKDIQTVWTLDSGLGIEECDTHSLHPYLIAATVDGENPAPVRPGGGAAAPPHPLRLQSGRLRLQWVPVRAC